MRESKFFTLDRKLFQAARKIAHCRNKYSQAMLQYQRQLKRAVLEMEAYLKEGR